jgi:hypothetical protein
MRNDELKLRALTEMSAANANPLDKDEIRAKLETARFEEHMYWEGKKRSLLRMILYVLMGVLLALTLQPMMPFLASRLGENHRGIETQRAFDVTPSELSVRRHLP